MKLEIELVPSSAWYTNLRSILSKKEWDYIRKMVYEHAENKCQTCGEDGISQGSASHKVEAHEVWEYDDANHIQRLKYIEALCPKCHRVKHIGLAGINGQTEECIAHLMNVNGISRSEAVDHINKSMQVFEERSEHEWTLDISVLYED
jgi:hypothetical protein